MNKKKYIIIAICALLAYFFGISSDNDFFNFTNSYQDIDARGKLSVSFVDVGQGDCSVIKLPDEKIMMIDAGDNGHEGEVIDFLRDNKIKKIDYLIATHPHSDHIGGMSEVISRFEIGNIYMPKVSHTSETFKSMINEITKKNLKIHSATAEKVIVEDKDLSIKFIAPVNDKYDDLNNYSAGVKLLYKNNSFLFCGDMEQISENEVLNLGANINCDVLKVAHHGSSTSSGDKFLEKASAKYAVISCGKDNDYNHPHNEVIKRLKKNDNIILRTDKKGTITFVSDGNSIEYITQY